MRRYLALGLALVAVGSCSPTGNDGSGPTVAVATVTVAPALDTVYIGALSQFTATTKDADGNVLSGRSVTWSKTGTGATISAGGLVTGTASGDVTVTATSEGVGGNASVVIRPVPVVSVLLTPPTDTIYLGATATFTATPHDSIGGSLTGRVITWSSLDAAASVNNVGVVTALSIGTARIAAIVEGKGDTTLVTVLPVPVASVVITPSADTLYPTNTVQLAAATRDSASNVLAGRVIAWNSLDAAASVNGTGLVTANSLGTARIVATSEGKADTALITVAAVPVSNIVVTPAADTLYPTNTVQLTAVTRDSASNILAGRVIVWSSLDAAATVNGTGLVTAVSVGTARVVGTSEGKTDTALITVLAVPVSSLILTPDSAQVSAGATAQFTASPRDSIGGALAGRVISWSTLDSTVATVSSSGLVTGVAAGTTSLIAVSEGKGDTSLVVVDTLPTPLAPLTGDWNVLTYDSVSGGGGALNMTLVQSDTLLSGNWQGLSDSGSVTGTVHGAAAVVTLHNVSQPGGDCDAVISAGRLGSDSLLGPFQFAGGAWCTHYGTVSAHRGSPTGPGSEFDIAVTSDRESGEASASDGTNVLVGYHQADASGPTSPSEIRFVLLDPTGTAISSVVQTGQTGNEPAVAFGGGGYFALYARRDSSFADLTGLFINSAGVAVGSPFSIKVGARGCGLAYAGGTFGILYADASLPDSLTQIYFRRISTGGTIGPEVVVASAPATCNRTAGPLASDGSGFLAIIDRPDGTAIRTRTISVADALGTMNTIATAAGGGLIFSEVTPISGGWAAVWNSFYTSTNSQSQYAVLAGDGSGSSLGTVGETGGSDAIVSALHPSGAGFALAWVERPADPLQSVARFRRFDASGAPVGPAITIATTQGGRFPLPLTMETFGTSFLVVINRYDLGSSIGDWDPETGDVRGVVVTP